MPREQPYPLRHKTITHVRSIGVGCFVQDFLTPRRPVVIAGVAEHWDASSAWTLDHLASIVGDVPVQVFRSRTPAFHPEVQHAYDRMRVELRFSDYVKIMRNGGANDGYYYYLATAPFAKQHPALEKDVDFSSFFADKEEVEPNIWISLTGTVTPLHFDPFHKHNFHVVIRGQKRFVLYAPEARSFLAPYPPEARIQQFSQVDPANADLRRFPEFAKAQGFECLLEDGDMLFLPMYWWHQVITQSTTISVNVWWREELLKRESK